MSASLREFDMSSAFETRSGDHFFLLAAITAVVAAVFMVTVWAPLQVRAFDAASNGQLRVVQSASAAN